MIEKLTADQRAAALKELKGWQSVEGRDAIQRSFKFKNFNEAWGFMNRVALMADNGPHWPTIDFATLCMGGVLVPVYPTLLPEGAAYIVNDSGAKVLFVQGEARLRALLALRHEMPFNCRKRAHRLQVSADAAADVERVLAIWRETRRRHGGAAPFLFGDFGIADAMYAPVVLRFVSHGISLDGDAQDYAAAITDLQALRDWLDEAATEPLSDVHERMKP